MSTDRQRIFKEEEGSVMLTTNYQRLIESGVDQWNQWRHQNPNQYLDLRGIDLTNSYLFEINLMGSDLRGADFRRACLIGANLSQANLSGANLGGAYLSQANFREANLSNANLIDAHMANVDLLEAILVGTCLEPVKQTVAKLTHSSAPISQTALAPTSQIAAQPDSLEENQKGIYPEKQQHKEQPCQSNHPEQLTLNSLASQAQPLPHWSIKKSLSQSHTSGEHTPIATAKQTEASTAQSKVWISKVWSPALLEQCHNKLCDYYIGPMVTLILDDIVTIKRPSTKRQFIELVAAHIPVTQEALSFRHRFSTNSSSSHLSTPPSNSISTPLSNSRTSSYRQQAIQNSQASSKDQHHPQPARLISISALTQTCIEKCRQQLADYYIAPMAHMLIDDVIATHQPKTNRQFIKLITDHLPSDQVESFSQKVLS